jgi:hypothetical protein
MRVIPKTIAVTTLAAGASVLGLGLLSQPAAAIDLTFVSEGATVPEGWTNLNWTVEGRAGAKGFADWEFATKEDGEQTTIEQLEWDWQNDQEVPWLLTWDGNTVSFTLDGQTIAYYQDNPPAQSLDGFYLWTRATTKSGTVDPGTEIFLEVNEVNGIEVDPVSSLATAPVGEGNTEITKNYFASDTSITSLSGIANMSWLEGSPNPHLANARARVGLKIEGFSYASVPEPGTVAGIVGMGLFGVSSALRRKKA